MIYHSEMPVKVGEFDAESLHQRIDQIVTETGDTGAMFIGRHLGRQPDGRISLLKDVIGITPAIPFEVNMFVEGQKDQIEYIGPNAHHKSGEEEDEWHPDALRTFEPLVLLSPAYTAASTWPTEIVIGNIPIKLADYRRYHPFADKFWRSEVGKIAIESAIESGDAYMRRFGDGDVIKMPKGTIHRRNIPEDSDGYRYFMRLYPPYSALRSGTNLGRILPSLRHRNYENAA